MAQRWEVVGLLGDMNWLSESCPWEQVIKGYMAQAVCEVSKPLYTQTLHDSLKPLAVTGPR